MITELKRIHSLDPEHLPAEIALMEYLAAKLSSLPQMACFDTAFHHEIPLLAKMIAIHKRYETN